ncbi:MAG TPA: Lpg1974 family pore-forming outer membrane protein [Pirellulales bacterium]|nr:Lpg1974 family pore-forming outer membrane protein [Pirellulales bacterium]
MVRFSHRLRVLLICLAATLPVAAVGRASDSNGDGNPWPGPTDSRVSQAGISGWRSPIYNSSATNYESTPARQYDRWKGASLPDDSASQPTDPPPPRSSSPTFQRPAPKAWPSPYWQMPPGANSSPPRQYPPANKPQRDVRLAAHMEADQNQPEAPNQPQPPSQPSAAHDAPGGPAPTAAAYSEWPCEQPGYWAPQCDFLPCGRWFGGGEFLLVRPHQTGDTAFQISPNGGSGPAIQNVNFDSPYKAAFRTIVGIQTSCDQSLRFTYTNIFDDTLKSAAVPNGSVIVSPLGASINPGDSIAATDHLKLNLWDIENVRKLELPSCVCNGCPGWDVSWSWGARIIDLSETIKNEVSGPDAGIFTQQSTFVGAGPRLGLEIHRQLGESRVSGFFSADAALLLGGQDTTGTSTPSGTTSAQIVPNFDLRVGLCFQPRSQMAISVGWMFETFGNATMLNENASLALVSSPQANNLSYDGLFVRGELHY